MTIPEIWLRGPIPGIHPLLQPAAHALVQVGEDVLPLLPDLTPEQLWARPGGVAAIGFHVAHLPGSMDRPLTYSRGRPLSPEQLVRLESERSLHETKPELTRLMAGLQDGIDAAIGYLGTLKQEDLLVPREVGRKKMPSTTLGLIFHAAEHSSRHTGQVVTLSRIVRAA